MKSLRNKVILSGIVLLFAFIATIGSTYAWFTASTATEINSMEISVGAADNMLIKVWKDGVTYLNDGSGTPDDLATASNYPSTIITNQNLIDAGYLYDTPATLVGPWRLQPVTIVIPGYTGLNGKALNKITLADRSLSALTVAGTDFNSSSGYYIQLKFWLYSQAETDKAVTVNKMSVTTVAGNSVTQDAIVDAVRLSIWMDDTQFAAASPVNGTPVIFGKNVNYDYAFSGDFDNPSVGNTLDGVASVLTQPALNATAEAAVNLLNTTPTVYTIKPSTPTLVTVLIYVEGWNTAANNDVTEAAFNVSFGFKFV
ncbi:MAG: hypothetical protein RQ856_03695 [Candidatus Izemoplasmatales bacterium]|nr:hypothetical protein [Candidatus Izemoplasmatales bacterium]